MHHIQGNNEHMRTTKAITKNGLEWDTWIASKSTNTPEHKGLVGVILNSHKNTTQTVGNTGTRSKHQSPKWPMATMKRVSCLSRSMREHGANQHR